MTANKSSDQQDPIVCYLIVRKSLEMTMGKACAQTAHASQMLQMEYQKLHVAWRGWTADLVKRESNYEEWMNGDMRKVVLGADDKEWEKVKEVCKDNMVLVIDKGYTQVPEGSETVIGLFPMHKSQVPKVIKRLQVLK